MLQNNVKLLEWNALLSPAPLLYYDCSKQKQPPEVFCILGKLRVNKKMKTKLKL